MVLQIKGLCVHYCGAEALTNLTLEVEEGAIVALIGSNGAGKTTALRTISGLQVNTAGKIWFQGTRIDGNLPQDIVKLGIGHIPEGKKLFPYMTVLENLKLGAFLQKKSKHQINGDLERIFETFPGLKSKRLRQARILSGGEQQMLAIARALMGSPKLLLMDEPSLGLSPLIVQEIGKIVRYINQKGASVLLVEQNAQLALKLAHKGYVLETGKIVLQGDSKDLLEDQRLKRSYLGR